MPDGVVAVLWALRVPSVPLQALDPSVVADAPATVRAAAVFLTTVLFGGVVVYRYGGRVDEAAGASRERPLLAVVYGLGAFGFVLFVVAFGLSELSRAGVGLRVVSTFVFVALAVMVLSLGAVGFAVVGVLLADAFGFRDPMLGLVGAAGASAVAWFLLPVVPGALVWVVIAAVGVGGPTRRWVHRDSVDAARAERGQD